MCISLENARSYRDDDEKDKQFEKKLARRDRLKKLVKEKYPEVYELLMEFYQEKW